MERLEGSCSLTIFAVWGLYSLAVLALTGLAAAEGWPAWASWLIAAAGGWAVLGWMREA